MGYTDMTTEDTRDDREVVNCRADDFYIDGRHGPHSHGHGDEFWCEGSGLVTVSFSELDTFRQCFMKHDLAYTQRWSRESSDASALGLGSLFHRVMEEHYKTLMACQRSADEGDGVTWGELSTEDVEIACTDAVNALLAAMLEEEQRDPEVLTTILWMYEGYREHYGLDEEWDILAVESTSVLHLTEEDGVLSWVRLKVKLDLIVRDQSGRIWVVDHKSAGQVGRDDKDHDWDDQFGLYITAMRRMGMKVMGAIHNAVLKKPNKGDLIKPGDDGYKASMKETPLENRFKRTRLNRTEAECDSIMGDALADTRLAYSPANHKRRHTNPDTCKWRCDFKEACIYGRRTNSDENVILTLQRTGFAQEPIRH